MQKCHCINWVFLRVLRWRNLLDTDQTNEVWGCGYSLASLSAESLPLSPMRCRNLVVVEPPPDALLSKGTRLSPNQKLLYAFRSHLFFEIGANVLPTPSGKNCLKGLKRRFDRMWSVIFIPLLSCPLLRAGLWGLGSAAIFVVLHGCRSCQTDVVAEINSATFAFGLDQIHQSRTKPS